MRSDVISETPPTKRSREQPVNVAEIAGAALGIIDDVGLESLTMRRLADAIGVKPMTLYRNLPNKEAILAAVADKLWQELPPPDLTIPAWQLRLRAMWLDLFGLMQRHPHAIPLIARGGAYSTTAAADTAGVLGVLKEAGFTVRLANEFLHTASALVVGFAFAHLWQQQAAEGQGPPQPAGVVRPLPADLLEFAQAMRPFGPGEFESALDLVIGAFTARLDDLPAAERDS